MSSASADLRNDLGRLLLRVVVGAVFVAHGVQKFFDYGMSGVQASFAGMDIPLPDVSAWFVAVVELVGGALLILGAASTVVGVLLAVVAGGAFVFVHISNGFFVENGGFELVAALGAGALAIALIGAGSWSVDGVLRKRA